MLTLIRFLIIWLITLVWNSAYAGIFPSPLVSVGHQQPIVGEVAPCSSYQDKPSIKAYWLFENNTNDSSGNGYNLTAYNSPSYDSTNEIEGSYSIDLESGSQQYLAITNAAFGTFPSTFTVLGKFRLESIPSVSVLVSKWYHVDNQRTFQIRVETGGAVTLWHSIELDPYYLSTTVSAGLTTGVNYAFAYSYSDATRDYRFEVYNLDTSASTVVRTGTWTSPIYISTADFMIGNRQGAIYYFDGVVDEVAVLSEAMTATEISEFFTGECSEGSTPGGGEEPVYDHVYYVSQSGTDTSGGTVADGAGPENPYSALQINGGYIAGDYSNSVFYCSGTFTSRLVPLIYGSAAGNVVFDGYEADNSAFGALSEVSGRAVIDCNSTLSSIGLELNAVSYITIRDFEIRECSSNAVFVNGSHDIVFERNFIYESSSGITLAGNSYNITIGGSQGNGNVLKNLGTTTADEDIALTDATDVIISHNHLYADSPLWGIDGVVIVGGVHNVLIEYNSIHDHERSTNGEDGIDIKKATSYDIVVRFNNIFNHTYQSCMTFQSSSHDIYAYGNLCRNAENGVITGDDDDGDGNDNIYIFGNLIYDIEEIGISIGSQGTNGDVFVFNNVLAENAFCVGQEGVGECRTPGSNSNWANIRIYDISAGTNTRPVIKNNILYKSRPNATNYQQIYVDSGDDTQTTADNNQYFWPTHTSTIFWGNSGLINLTGVKTGNLNGLPQEANGSEGDPGLSDIDNNDYSVASSGSAVYGAGEDLGTGNIASLTIIGRSITVPWGFAFGPNTNWSNGIPVIDEGNFDTIGRWDVGAYIYVP